MSEQSKQLLRTGDTSKAKVHNLEVTQTSADILVIFIPHQLQFV